MASVRSAEIAGLPALVAGEHGGERPPLVLIHGAFSHGAHFRPWLECLSERGLWAVAPTLRPAAVSLHRRSFEAYLEAARSVLAAVGPGPSLPTVVGHSLGGLIAQKIAEAGECSAAVLIASAPAGMLTAQPRSLPYLLPLFPRILAGLPLQPRESTLSALVLHGVDEADRGALLESFVGESGRVYRQMIFGLVRVTPARVRCPVLCIGGTDDRIVSRRLVRATARRLGAPLREYAGRGHWLIAEPGWQELVGDVVAWLDQQQTGDPKLASRIESSEGRDR